MGSIFESERVRNSARPLRPAAQRLLLMFPNMEWELKKAGYAVDAVQYLAIAIFISIVVFIVSITFITTPLLLRAKYAESSGSIGVVAIITVISFIYVMLIPRFKILRRGHLIDKNLEYMLKDMQIQLTAGIPLFDTLVNIAKGGYGECSKMMNEIIQDVQSGKSIIGVLDDFGMLSPSEYMRRVLWQIVNAVKTGSNVVIALKAISNDIQLEKENRIKIYGQELNLWALIYMMSVIVAPSMGVTLLVILSSFIGGKMINESLFWVILFGVILFQIVFVSIIRSKRPDIG